MFLFYHVSWHYISVPGLGLGWVPGYPSLCRIDQSPGTNLLPVTRMLMIECINKKGIPSKQSSTWLACTLGKSSNRSPGNFNVLAKINNIQKIYFSQRHVFLLQMIRQIFILINQFTQFPSREKDGYPNSVKSHLIRQYLGLKTGKNNENLSFRKKKLLNCKIFFSVKGNN